LAEDPPGEGAAVAGVDMTVAAIKAAAAGEATPEAGEDGDEVVTTVVFLRMGSMSRMYLAPLVIRNGAHYPANREGMYTRNARRRELKQMRDQAREESPLQVREQMLRQHRKR
jgi:hypothetical protein